VEGGHRISVPVDEVNQIVKVEAALKLAAAEKGQKMGEAGIQISV
jgi:hypothetical protein